MSKNIFEEKFGFRIFKDPFLPPSTLMVSEDVYEKLTETPEQREAREQAVVDLFSRTEELMKSYGWPPK